MFKGGLDRPFNERYESCIVRGASREQHGMDDSTRVDALRRRIAELEEMLARESRVQDALRGSRLSSGISFFDLSCLELAYAAGADIALIGTLLPDQQTVKTIGLCVDGAIA